jgi:hypothetical protein
MQNSYFSSRNNVVSAFDSIVLFLYVHSLSVLYDDDCEGKEEKDSFVQINSV